MAKKVFNTFSNLAISLDGKIADPAHPQKMLGTACDRKVMQDVRKKAQVVLFGASTLKATGKGAHISGQKGALVNGVITASGKLPKNIEFWKDPKTIRFVFTTREGYANAVDSSGGRAFVVECGKKFLNADLIIKRLLDSGYKDILIEGGGQTMALFLEASLLQHMFVTITPRLLGGETPPTLVSGDKLLWKNLELVELKRVKNELFTKYRVKGAKIKL